MPIRTEDASLKNTDSISIISAIETTRREMYRKLSSVPLSTLQLFEVSLEAHLEALRLACDGHEALHQTARKRFDDIQVLEQKCAELTKMNDVLVDAYQNQKGLTHEASIEAIGLDDELVGARNQLARMTSERDTLRNRVQALEFACQAAGDALRQIRSEAGCEQS